MGRQPRVEYKGAIYHVIQRGNNREFIFNEEIDKGYFVKKIKEAKQGMGFKIFAYVLMDNHYHFLMQTLDEPLNKIMHQINNVYSKYYNYKYGHFGHVFQGRYKGILVLDENYLIQLVKYIEQNPIRAKMCSSVRQYKWSSDIFFRKNINGFIDIDVVLNMLSNKRSEAIIKYMNLIEEIEDKDFENVNVIGEDAYKIMESSKNTATMRKDLNQILIDTGISVSDYKLLKDGSRRRDLTSYKIAYIKAALELKYTMNQIGENIKMSDTAVHNILKRNEI